MFTHYRTQGFVLKKVDQGDDSQLFTIYTKDFGKLEVLGKAIRKIKSKLKSGVNLFSLSEIEFIQGKVYKTLTDAILIKKSQNLKGDFKKLKITYKFSDIFDNLVKESERDKKLWHLLNEFFEKLNSYKLPARIATPARSDAASSGERSVAGGPVTSHQLIYYYFTWNLLSVLGYSPELYNCTLCQKKLSPTKIFFSLKEGGLICSQCKELSKNIREISSDSIKIIRILVKKDWKMLKRLKIEEKELKSFRVVSDYYLSEIIEKNS